MELLDDISGEVIKAVKNFDNGGFYITLTVEVSGKDASTMSGLMKRNATLINVDLFELNDDWEGVLEWGSKL